MKKPIIVGAFSVSAIACVVMYAAHKKTPVVTAPAVQPVAPVVSAQAALPQTEQVLGLLGRYRLSYQMHLSGPDGAVDYTVTGSLDVAAEDDTRIAVLTDARGGYSTNASRDDLANNPREAYARPWRMRLQPNGTVAETSFATEMPQAARAVLYQIAAATQLSLSDDDNRTWTAVETDSNGSYEVSYKRTGVTEFTKQWSAAPLVAGKDDIFGSKGDATITTGRSAIETVQVKIAQRFRLSTRAEREVHSTIQISLVRERAEPSAALAAMSATQDMGTGYAPLDRQVAPLMTQKEKDEQRVAGRSFERIVEDIEKADLANAWAIRKSFGRDLAALIRLQPLTAQLTAERIATVTKEPVRRTLTEALAYAGSPAAQSGLVKVMSDERVPRDGQDAARSVSAFIEEPESVLIDRLDKDSRSTHPKTRSAALIALGSVLTNSEDTERLAAFLNRGREALANEAPALSTRDTVIWLRALGATYEEQTLPLFADALKAKSPLVRGQAALSIGLVGGDLAKPLLIDRLTQDPDYLVRHHALSTLGDLGPVNALEATKIALVKDEEAAVRAQAAYVIGVWADKDPSLKTVLTDAISGEHERVVIETILDMTVPGRGYTEGKKTVQMRRSL